MLSHPIFRQHHNFTMPSHSQLPPHFYSFADTGINVETSSLTGFLSPALEAPPDRSVHFASLNDYNSFLQASVHPPDKFALAAPLPPYPIFDDLSPPSSIYSEEGASDSSALSSPLLTSPQPDVVEPSFHDSPEYVDYVPRRSNKKPIDMSDPIQPRTYQTQSRTARKAIPKDFAKRATKVLGKGVADIAQQAEQQLEDLAPEIINDIKQKRLRNTLAARRSRENKRSQVAQMQETITTQSQLITALEAEIDTYRTRYGPIFV